MLIQRRAWGLGAGTVPLNGAAERTDIFTLYKHTAKEKEEKELKKLNQVGLIRFFLSSHFDPQNNQKKSDN